MQDAVAKCKVVDFIDDKCTCCVYLPDFELPSVEFPAWIIKRKGLSVGSFFVWNMRDGDVCIDDIEVCFNPDNKLSDAEVNELDRLYIDYIKRKHQKWPEFTGNSNTYNENSNTCNAHDIEKHTDELWRKEIEKYVPEINFMSFAGPISTIEWLINRLKPRKLYALSWNNGLEFEYNEIIELGFYTNKDKREEAKYVFKSSEEYKRFKFCITAYFVEYEIEVDKFWEDKK